MEAKDDFRIKRRMFGDKLMYVVLHNEYEYKESFWFWKNPKCIGKRWKECGFVQRYCFIPYRFKSVVKAEQYIKNRILVSQNTDV